MNVNDLKQVGELMDVNRPVIRTLKNPLDICTIISVYPKDVIDNDNKPTIHPNKFHIPAGTIENPSRLVVKPSSWFRDMNVDQPLIEIAVSSVQIATSVIEDYCKGLFLCDMSDRMPGLFFVPGDVPVKEIKVKYSEMLEKVNKKQNAWFELLVKSADSLWARSMGNPLVIWDEMQMAAERLNYRDKPWMGNIRMQEMVRCVACGSSRNPQFPVCPTCKNVDMAHPLATTLKFAQ